MGISQVTWEHLTSMPSARYNLAAVAYDGFIYAISGEVNGGPTGQLTGTI